MRKIQRQGVCYFLCYFCSKKIARNHFLTFQMLLGSFQVEGYLGYAHWVCHTLLSENNDHKSMVIKSKPLADLSHIPAKYKPILLSASVALTKYTGWLNN